MAKQKQRSVNPEDLPYRLCVGIMVLNSNGLVWAGRRIPVGNSEYDGSPQLWQMPQGGIDADEDAYQAALRELYEETGMRSVEVVAEAPDWIDYDLPDHLIGIGLKGKYRGQRQRWFALRFTGDETEIRINPPPEGHGAEFDAWEWKPMGDLPGLIVPFKRKAYDQVIAAFAHLGADTA
ncbi:MAG: RNA pyrophosphohydrolase [Hoeflea sp.]|uniref:RNA pyrophosphohydrolase n=1 Tax=Hoeflea sp. TaxID=1940281 RepID=UPI003296DAD2